MNKIKTSFFISFPYLLFFSFSFAFFCFFADYILFYQEKSSLFVFSSGYLFETINKPGGLLIYISDLLSAFFYYPAAGAIIISGILTLIPYSVSLIVFHLTGIRGKIIPFITGILLFFLQTDYRFFLYYNFGLLLQLILFLYAIRYLKYLRGWVPVIISPCWYLATGGFSWIYVVLITFYYEFYKSKKGFAKTVVLWCAMLLIYYLSAEFLFFQDKITLLLYPFSLKDGSRIIPFLVTIALVSTLPFLLRIKLPDPGKFRMNDLKGSIFAAMIILVLMPVTGAAGFDRKNKNYFHIEKLFYERKFDEIIVFNRENTSTNSLTIFLNNIALCEKGLLNDQLFDFLQSPDGKTLFLKWEMHSEVLRRGGYFYYTIGMINEAHRWAYENMVMNGQTPEGLKMLIKTELINGNYRMASKYIQVLKKSLFYKKEGKALEKFLFNDEAVINDEELGSKRKIKIKIDFFSITDDPYVNIERILASDSLNKNAFEYKIAFLLLRKDYKGIQDQLPEFSGCGFNKLPINVEEAVTALSVMNNGIMPELGKIGISRTTITKWDQYLTLFQQNGNNPKTAEPALKRQFGNTFWYWAFYR